MNEPRARRPIQPSEESVANTVQGLLPSASSGPSVETVTVEDEAQPGTSSSVEQTQTTTALAVNVTTDAPSQERLLEVKILTQRWVE